eukprot:12034943-Alexandrium_andersonii.AAC.1
MCIRDSARAHARARARARARASGQQPTHPHTRAQTHPHALVEGACGRRVGKRRHTSAGVQTCRRAGARVSA